jgi:hypothetical protein
MVTNASNHIRLAVCLQNRVRLMLHNTGSVGRIGYVPLPRVGTPPPAISENLERILDIHADEFDGPPFAAFGNAGNGRSLVIAYRLEMRNAVASEDSVTTISGYRLTERKFRFVAAMSECPSCQR